MFGNRRRVADLAILGITTTLSIGARDASAQQPAEPQHQHTQMNADEGSWQFMQDAVVFAEFNHQGGPRGGDEFVVPNWWMGMATRNTARGRLTFSGMLSLDPATVGANGYRELFQVGEAFDGRPLIDRQHPHDFFMQLAAIWRMPIGESTGLTIAGALVGEPALGPIAFMHRMSAADNPTAPLGHHTFDSTHIAFGVVTAAVDRGRWVVEGSLFNGREPDEDRWNFDFGRLDSYSGRVWFRPAEGWEIQASTGHLENPEELEPGNIRRSTTSLAWARSSENGFGAMTIAFGRNDTDHGSRNAFLAEGAARLGKNGVYGRFEAVQTETFVLATGEVPEHRSTGVTLPPRCPSLVHCVEPLPPPDQRSTVLAFTLGGIRDVMNVRGFEGGFGAGVTFYAPPQGLRPAYGRHPVSFQLFFRLRAPATGRMWNMRMAQPMTSHVGSPMGHAMP
jgi:hypothetical protein